MKAGFGLSTGGNNILIGYQAGDNLTTGTDNIIIGYDIDASAVGVHHELNIGGLIKGHIAAALTLGFFGTAPAIQHAHIADAAGGTEIVTINHILEVLESYGLLAL
jgi:hypothetical protein